MAVVGLTRCLTADASAGYGLRGPSALGRPVVDIWRFVRESQMAVDLSMSVLVVDDYNTMIRIIRNLLKQLGFEHIDDASDGSAALNKMRAKKYGLVISDWNMEPMTGYDLLREVRADLRELGRARGISHRGGDGMTGATKGECGGQPDASARTGNQYGGHLVSLESVNAIREVREAAANTPLV